MSSLINWLSSQSNSKRRSTSFSSTPDMAAPLHLYPQGAASNSDIFMPQLLLQERSSPSAPPCKELERAAPDPLTSTVILLANAEVRRIMSECLRECASLMLRPVLTENAGDPPGNEEFNDIQQKQALLKIKELNVELVDSSEKCLKLQEEVKMLNPDRCALKEGSFDESAPSPRLLQEALRAAQIALFNCSAMMAERVKFYLKKDHRVVIHRMLCLSLFDDFETSSFGGTQHGAGFQRPDKDRKRRLFQDFKNYKTVDELQLFTSQETLFEAYYNSRFHIFVKRLHSAQLPFAKILQDENNPKLFPPPFASLAKAVWLLHKLAFACEPNAEIFRVHDGSHYDSEYMYVQDGEQEPGTTLVVDFMTAPGFTIQNSILKAMVQLKRNKV